MSEQEGRQHTPEPWSQGLVLDTDTTRRWSRSEIGRANEQERRMVFANFTASDEGESRVRVAICESPEDARRIVACVNACAGITTAGLESWLSPPAGSIGIEGGSWAEQLNQQHSRLAAWEAGTASQAARTMIATADTLLQQRDQLLAALVELFDMGQVFTSAIEGDSNTADFVAWSDRAKAAITAAGGAN